MRINYQIFIEAEDISSTRIISCRNFVCNFFENCGNIYFRSVEIEDESDLEDYVLRLYAERAIEEECSSPEDAENFLGDMAEFLNKLAQAMSFLQMDGSFAMEYQGKKESYRFCSEEGQDYCEIVNQ